MALCGSSVTNWNLSLDRASLNEHPFWHRLQDEAFVSLKTSAYECACAIHACIGHSTEHRGIEAANPRAWIQKVIDRYKTAADCRAHLEEIMGITRARDLFTSLTTLVESELFLAGVRGEDRMETQCFIEALQNEAPELLAEGQIVLTDDADMDDMKDIWYPSIYIGNGLTYKSQGSFGPEPKSLNIIW